jgi:hypothetical protein
MIKSPLQIPQCGYLVFMATSHTSHEFWNLSDSLRRAQLRADRYYKQKRALETKLRDTLRSRDAWKDRYQKLSSDASSPMPPPLGLTLDALADSNSLRVPRHHYGTTTAAWKLRIEPPNYRSWHQAQKT